MPANYPSISLEYYLDLVSSKPGIGGVDITGWDFHHTVHQLAGVMVQRTQRSMVLVQSPVKMYMDSSFRHPFQCHTIA